MGRFAAKPQIKKWRQRGDGLRKWKRAIVGSKMSEMEMEMEVWNRLRSLWRQIGEREQVWCNVDREW